MTNLYTEAGGYDNQVDGNPDDRVEGDPDDGMDKEAKETDKGNNINSSDGHTVWSVGEDVVDFHEEKPTTPPISSKIKVLV